MIGENHYFLELNLFFNNMKFTVTAVSTASVLLVLAIALCIRSRMGDDYRNVSIKSIEIL